MVLKCRRVHSHTCVLTHTGHAGYFMPDTETWVVMPDYSMIIHAQHNNKQKNTTTTTNNNNTQGSMSPKGMYVLDTTRPGALIEYDVCMQRLPSMVWSMCMMVYIHMCGVICFLSLIFHLVDLLCIIYHHASFYCMCICMSCCRPIYLQTNRSKHPPPP